MPSNRRGGGLKLDIKLEGGAELAAQLRAIGASMAGTMAEAAQAGGNVALEPISRDAPGPGVIMIDATAPRDAAAVEIGPEKSKWYYQFFETGVQPFEIDMVRRRSKRSAIDKQATAKKGKETRMRGRRVAGKGRVLVFPGGSGEKVFSRRVSRGAMAAKPFMRNNFFEKASAMIQAVGDVVRRRALGGAK